MAVEGGVAVVAHGGGQEMVLDVGPFDPRPGADEGTGFEVVGGAEPVLEQDPADPDQQLGKRPQLAVEGDRLAAAELKVDLQVVLQVLADPGQIVGDRDPGRAQHRARADARELQDLGRADRTGRQDHLARGHGRPVFVALEVGDADRPLAVEDHSFSERAGDHGQVDAAPRRLQVGVRRRGADPVPDRHVHGAEALLLVAVVVRGLRVAGLLAGLDEGAVQRVLHPVAVAGAKRPLGAAVRVAAAGPGLGLAEVGQAVAVGPAGRALGLPLVEVAGVAAHVDHAVDRGRAAQHLAARAVEPAAVQVGLGLGLETPVVARHVHRDGERGRHLDEDAAVAAPRLEQQHAGAHVLAQAVSQHAAGRAGADDDVIEALLHGRNVARNRRRRNRREIRR